MAAQGEPDPVRAAAGSGERGPAGRGPAAAGAGAGRMAFLTLRFGVELWTFVVLAMAGASASAGLAARIVLAIAGPLVFAVIWGLFMGPRARRRLRNPRRLIAELVIFAVSGALAGVSGHWLAAVIYLVVAIGAAALSQVIVPEP